MAVGSLSTYVLAFELDCSNADLLPNALLRRDSPPSADTRHDQRHHHQPNMYSMLMLTNSLTVKPKPSACSRPSQGLVYQWRSDGSLHLKEGVSSVSFPEVKALDPQTGLPPPNTAQPTQETTTERIPAATRYSTQVHSGLQCAWPARHWLLGEALPRSQPSTPSTWLAGRRFHQASTLLRRTLVKASVADSLNTSGLARDAGAAYRQVGDIDMQRRMYFQVAKLATKQIVCTTSARHWRVGGRIAAWSLLQDVMES
jgi:hypothetical protein